MWQASHWQPELDAQIEEQTTTQPELGAQIQFEGTAQPGIMGKIDVGQAGLWL